MRKRLAVFLLGLCIVLGNISMLKEDTRAAIKDVYYKEDGKVLYGSWMNPIMIDGYYCEISGAYNGVIIYATNCKGKTLTYPAKIAYNHKIYQVKSISELYNDSESPDIVPEYKNRKIVEKIVVPKGVRRVSFGALAKWKNLKEIRIPASVDKSLVLVHANRKVVVDKKNKKYKTSKNGVYTKNSRQLVATFYSKKNFTVMKGTKSIGFYAFQNYKQLKKLTMPSTIKKIEPTAFAGCKNLKSIILQGKKAPLFKEEYIMDSVAATIPKKVTIYVKNKKVKKAVEKNLKIGDLKKLKWRVKIDN